jgi:hypothetical protein
VTCKKKFNNKLINSKNYFTFFRNKRTQNHLTKVYAALGSGACLSLISGIAADKGFLPITVVGGLFLMTIIAEIYLIFFRSGKFTNTYIKPGTFFAYTIAFGGLIGNLFLGAPRSDRKM